MIRCPCCGYLTIEESYEEVIVEICEVCFWQYDWVAQKYPNRVIGPNKISLNLAKENYINFGASEKKFIGLVRLPRKDEI